MADPGKNLHGCFETPGTIPVASEVVEAGDQHNDSNKLGADTWPDHHNAMVALQAFGRASTSVSSAARGLQAFANIAYDLSAAAAKIAAKDETLQVNRRPEPFARVVRVQRTLPRQPWPADRLRTAVDLVTVANAARQAGNL